MTMRGASHKRTLCEVLREINDMFQGDGERDREVRQKLAEAEGMAKRMAHKLLEYNKKVFADWWKENPEYETSLKKRLKGDYHDGED